MYIYCLTQRGVPPPPPLGRDFSISSINYGDERISSWCTQCFFDISEYCVDNKVSEKSLVGEISNRGRTLISGICEGHQVEILRGHIARDHIHLFVSIPPNLAPSKLLQQLKGKTSHVMLNKFSELRR